MGYFTSRSSIAEMSCQQLYRIRQTRTNQIILHISDTCKPPISGLTFDDIRQHYVQTFDTLGYSAFRDIQSLKEASNLIPSHPFMMKINPDNTFFKLFCYCSLKINESKRSYKRRMVSLLKRQGVTITGYVSLDRQIDDDALDEEITDIVNGIRKKELERIVDAPLMTEEEFLIIESKRDIPLCHRYSYHKTKILRTFNMDDESQITEDFIKTYRGLKSAYIHLNKLIGLSKVPKDSFDQTFIKWIHSRYSFFEPWMEKTLIVNRETGLLDKKDPEYIEHKDDMYQSVVNQKDRLKTIVRITELHHIVKHLGFYSFFDKSEVEINVEAAWNYAQQNNLDKIFELEFKVNPPKKPKDSKTKPKHNVQSSKLRKLNGLLSTHLSLSIKRSKTKGSKAYKIYGWELWNVISHDGNIFVVPKGITPKYHYNPTDLCNI